MASDAEKIEELTAIIQTVRDRVRARYPKQQPDAAAGPGIQIGVADLLPIVHARDAAQAKIAAIGSVNPRAGGLLNRIIQIFKKAIARSLQWFVRDQVTFNRETISAIEAVMEALNDQNRILLSLASQTNEHLGYAKAASATVFDTKAAELSVQIDARAAELHKSLQTSVRPISDQLDLLKMETTELKDIRKHWVEWRAEWERKLALNEIQFLRSVADLQGASQHRATLMESNFRDIVKAQHTDYLGALDRANLDIQKRLWTDMEKIRGEFERLIHSELRLIRQRSASATPPAAPAQPCPAEQELGFDYARFAERFRGAEDYVRQNVAFYKPYFERHSSVLDIGCGRGEFLEAMRDLNVAAIGIDLSKESVQQCRAKGLAAETADLFAYLASQPDAAFDGIFSSQVVEHLAPERLPEMISLCSAKLQRGGLLAVETPNPECLAIFATHFYLDPTHTRPVPSPLLSFYMEEAGLGMIEVHPLSPALETMPELADLPESFRNRFFGGLDYAIVARKL